MRKLVFGLALPLTGAYALSAGQIERALQLFISDANAAGFALGGEPCELGLVCLDDASRRDRAAEIYRSLCADRHADLLLGPYSTALTRAVIPVTEDARMLLVNHGGAADDLHEGPGGGPRMLVSVLSPASTYMHGFIRLVASLKMHRKRIAIAAADYAFLAYRRGRRRSGMRRTPCANPRRPYPSALHGTLHRSHAHDADSRPAPQSHQRDALRRQL